MVPLSSWQPHYDTKVFTMHAFIPELLKLSFAPPAPSQKQPLPFILLVKHFEMQFTNVGSVLYKRII